MKRRDRGQVLVLVALAIFVLLGLAALGVDAGYMYSVRHELQRCADSGALAGASVFTTKDWNDSVVQGEADGLARIFATKDLVVGEPLTPRVDNVEVDFPKFDHIRVKTMKNVPLFFARIFGETSKTITAYAVARAEMTDIKSDCVKPFAIPFPWNDNGPNSVLEDGSPNGLYDPGEIVYPGPPELAQGTRMTIKIGGKNIDNTASSQMQTSGQFFIIQGNNPIEGSTEVINWQGSAEYCEYIINNCFDVKLGNPLDLMPGGRMGPTDQCVQALINKDLPNTWDSANNAPMTLDSPRVIRIAMYDPSEPFAVTGGGGQSGGSGTNAEVSVGYSIHGFWLEKICGASDMGKDPDCPKGKDDKGSVIGRYIANMGTGSSTGNNPENPTGTEVKKIALVE